MNQQVSKFFLPILLLFFISGCTYNVAFNPSYLPTSEVIPASKKLDGKGLIYMSPSDASYVFSDNPTTFTGGGTKLTLNLGDYTREIATKVYSNLFIDGVDFSTNESDGEGYILIISPKVTRFSFGYNQAQNLGFAITPEVTISIQVIVMSPDGEQLFERTYSPPLYQGQTYMASFSPDEKINQAAHILLHDTFYGSFVDIRQALTE